MSYDPSPRDATPAPILGSGVGITDDLDRLVRITDATRAADAERRKAEDARKAEANAPILAYRKRLLKHGYFPMPVSSPDMDCKDAGKNPAFLGWQHLAFKAGERQHEKWMRIYPDSTNTGILPGPDVVLLDIDIDDEGIAVDAHGRIVAITGPTWTKVRRNSKRVTLVFRCEPGLPKVPPLKGTLMNGDKRAGIEFRTGTEQIVVAGMHHTGVPIEWELGGEPVDGLPSVDDLPVLTRAHLDAIIKACAPLLGADAPKAGNSSAKAGTSTNGAPSQESMAAVAPRLLVPIVRALPNDSAFNDRGKWIAMAHALAAAFPEQRYQGAGRKLWLEFCAKRPQAEGEPERVWNTLAPPHQIGAQWIVARAREAVAREKAAGVGLSALATAVAAYEDAVHAARLAEAQGEFDATEEPPPGMAEQLAPPAVGGGKVLTGEIVGAGDSEIELALAFTKHHAGRLVFISDLRGWHAYPDREDGTEDRRCFVRDKQMKAEWLAQKFMYEKARSDDGKVSAGLAAGRTVFSLLKLARSHKRVARSASEFDADPWLLNTPGGVLDLRTGKLRERKPGELFLKIAAATPGGECPRWLQFIAEITMGDAELAAYLQRFAGYTLTGCIDEHAFLVLHGEGGNGKGLLTNTLAPLLGDYATVADETVFMETRNDQHPAAIAALRGARMVLLSEIAEGRRWNEPRLKGMIAGDPISARVMRGDPFVFHPGFKLWVAANHLPTMRNPGSAMRRRANVAAMRFKPAAVDLKLGERLLATEPRGILAWAAQGCLDWQEQGLDAPAAVRDATDAYFGQQDRIGAWIEERCEPCPPDPKDSAGVRELYGSYRVWMHEVGEVPKSEVDFSAWMEGRYQKKSTKTANKFLGIRLRPKATDEFTLLE